MLACEFSHVYHEGNVSGSITTHLYWRSDEHAAAETDEDHGKPFDDFVIAVRNAVKKDESDGDEDGEDVDDPSDDSTPPRKRQLTFGPDGLRGESERWFNGR